MFLNKCRDKSREKQRQQNLLARKERGEAGKRERGKKKSEKACATSKGLRKLTGKRRQAIQTAEDREELARDYRLLKKRKKGSITEDEYAELTGINL